MQPGDAGCGPEDPEVESSTMWLDGDHPVRLTAIWPFCGYGVVSEVVLPESDVACKQEAS